MKHRVDYQYHVRTQDTELNTVSQKNMEKALVGTLHAQHDCNPDI